MITFHKNFNVIFNNTEKLITIDKSLQSLVAKSQLIFIDFYFKITATILFSGIENLS